MRKTALTLLLAAAALSAQNFHNNQERTLNCDDQQHNNGQSRSCDVREQTLTPQGSLHIDAGANGGVTVKGWNQNEILVRSRVEAWGHSPEEAKSLASSVSIQASPGNVHPQGPETHGHNSWSVSFEVFVPHQTSVTARASNGGVHVADIAGTLDLETVNGGLNLARVSGDVKGSTVNGGVHVTLTGNHWEGRGLELSSTNGGVHITIPNHYSARFETSTVNGGVNSDLPEISAQHHAQSLNTTLGAGGALVHVSTVNGGVTISHGGADDDN